MALQYWQWVAWEIVTKPEMGMGRGLVVGGCRWLAGKPDWAGRTASIHTYIHTSVLIQALGPYTHNTHTKKYMNHTNKRAKSYN